MSTHERIWLSPPHMGGTELDYVKSAFDTNWIAPLGPNLEAFEQRLVSYTGVGHVAALSAGTAAIHLALVILGVQPRDKVLVSSFTFAASANPIKYLGAEPVFIGSENETWNLCPHALEEALADLKRQGCLPRALILVHLYGVPARFDEIAAICSSYNVPIIEDAAEALGSKYKNRPLGALGDIGVLSFNGNKIITASGGGAFLSNNEEFVTKAKFLATQARDSAPHYQHSTIGYNYRMSNVIAGIGLGQMEVIDDHIARRRANFEYYRTRLSRIKGFSFPDEPADCFSNRWLSTVLIDPKLSGGVTHEDVRTALDTENIEARPLWKPLHLQPVFRGTAYYGNELCADLFNTGLCLPSGSALTDDQLDRICEIVEKAAGI